MPWVTSHSTRTVAHNRRMPQFVPDSVPRESAHEARLRRAALADADLLTHVGEYAAAAAQRAGRTDQLGKASAPSSEGGPVLGHHTGAAGGAASFSLTGTAGLDIPADPPAVPLTAHEQSFAQLRQRIVVDGNDKIAWLKARARGITATDVAKLTSARSIESAAWAKLHGSGFSGNAYTEHGKAREPHIAAWVRGEYAIHPSSALFRSGGDARHLATPDGIAVRATGTIELSEIKTTNKSWRTIPRNYLRQVWWQQYVLGAERTLVVWEQHDDFVPLGDPKCQWVDRDDNEIHKLVTLANELIAQIIAKTNG